MATMGEKIGQTELNDILINSVHNSWVKQADLGKKTVHSHACHDCGYQDATCVNLESE